MPRKQTNQVKSSWTAMVRAELKLCSVVYGRCLGKETFEQRLQGRKRVSQADMLEEEGEGRDRI